MKLTLRGSTATLAKLSLIGCAASLSAVSPAGAAGQGAPSGCGTASATFAYGYANGSQGAFSCQVGDKILTNFGGNGSTSTPGGTGYGMDWGIFPGQTAIFTFSKSGNSDSYNLTFNQGTGITASGNITVPIAIAPSFISQGYTFKSIKLGSVTGISGAGTSVTATGTNFTSPLISSNGSESGLGTFTSGVTSTNVNIAWNIPSGQSITQFTLSFDQNNPTNRVPGPLPLLGAGAAFGFSRRLRSRVKAAA